MYLELTMKTMLDHIKNYKRFTMLLCLLFFGITASEAKDLPIGNSMSLPANVLFMIDTSGSMAWVVNQDTYPATLADSRIEKAKAVIKGVVNNPAFQGKVNFGLMQWNYGSTDSFNEWACNYYNPHYNLQAGDPAKEYFTPPGTKTCGEQLMVPISPTGAADITNMVDSLLPGGGTNIDAAMALAQSYLYGSASPVNPALPCAKNIIIVLSDGDWPQYSNALNIVRDFNAHNIQTYAVGFASDITTAGKLTYNLLAATGGSGQPYFVQDSATLSAVLTTVLTNVTNVPQTLQQVSGKDALIKASFLPINNHQWNGYLRKQTIDTNGNFVDLWEAGSLLNLRSYSDRKIWTALDGLTATTSNFVDTNYTLLSSALYPNLSSLPLSADIQSLINFVRGADAYNEFGGTRWKLADIYHSKPVLVKAPSDSVASTKPNTEAYYRYAQSYSAFVTQWASRQGVVYAGANDGMLHAFDSTTGSELWAFVPPPMLSKLNNMNAAQTGISNTMYGVDGSPQVKDIYLNGAWHTVLVCSLGRGGKAYFAMDITDPANPKHLYSFENDAINQKVYYWDASGKKYSHNYSELSANLSLDYSKLGDAWSDPTFVLMPTSTGQRWVFAVGSGYSGLSSSGPSASAFIFDATNGQVINRIDLSNNAGSDFQNGILSQMTKVGPDDFVNANYKGALLYFTDLQSSMWKLNLTDQGQLYHFEKVDYTASTLLNDRLSFNQLTAIDIGGLKNLFLMFGTGNLMNATRASNSIGNRFFAVKDKDFPGTANTDGAYPFDSSVKLNDLSQTTGQCSVSYDRGWYLNLNGYTDSSGANIGNNWRVLNAPIVFQQTIYLEIYQPNQNNPCAAGNSRLVLINLLCGNIMISSNVIQGAADQIFFYKGSLYLSTANDKLTNVSNIPDIKKFVTTYRTSKPTPIKYRTRIH